MTQPSWQEPGESVEVPGRPESGIWTVAIEYVNGPRKLKISASGSWGITSERIYGPDGDGFASGTDQCLVVTAPRGSLIAKIGGGTADLAGTVYPIGRLAVIDLPDAAGGSPIRGMLFLTMNDDPSRFRDHFGQLTVQIWEGF